MKHWRITWVPVWLATWVLFPFLPAAHPFRHLDLSLEGWTRHGTQTAWLISMVLWLQVIELAACVVIIYLRRA